MLEMMKRETEGCFRRNQSGCKPCKSYKKGTLKIILGKEIEWQNEMSFIDFRKAFHFPLPLYGWNINAENT